MDPALVLPTLRKHLLVDGYDFVLDLEASHGSRLVDARDGTTLPRHVHVLRLQRARDEPSAADRRDPEVQARLLRAATHKPSNSDVYTPELAVFVEDLRADLGDPRAAVPVLDRGRGARGRERAQGRVRLEVAAQRGRRSRPGPRDQGAAPDGRLPRPHRLHDEPHQHRPDQGRPVPEVRLAPDRLAGARSRWRTTPRRTRPPRTPPSARSSTRSRSHPHDIACTIAEPIQAEGGDRHLSARFLQGLQDLCPRARRPLHLDEVQTGVGMTGTPWAYQQLGLQPDLVAFGKKTHVCGIMAGGRVDEVDDTSSRSQPHQLDLRGRPGRHGPRHRDPRGHREEGLIARAAELGDKLLGRLQDLADRTSVRQRPGSRPDVRRRPARRPRDPRRGRLHLLEDERVILLGCGDHSIRALPAGADRHRGGARRGVDALERVHRGIR
jgi:L-lysine 6-transaminase